MRGQGRRRLHFDGGAWTPTQLDTQEMMLGIWAFAPDDIWMVGGVFWQFQRTCATLMNAMVKRIVLFGASMGLLTAIAFSAGVCVGERRERDVSRAAQREMAEAIYGKIKEACGSVHAGDPQYDQITQTITIYKDWQIAVIEEGGKKTLKVYE